MQNTIKQFQKGFTLVEILIVLGILVFIGLAVSTFQRELFIGNSFIQQSLSAQQDIRSALKKMSREIRPAASANTGAYTIGRADPDEFLFYSDTNDDGLYEQIRYFIIGQELTRGVVVPTGAPLTYNPANETLKTLVHDLATTSVFTYYDNTYTGTEQPLSSPFDIADIRMVKIMITVDADINKPPIAVTDETKIFIRSLKDNT